MTPTTNTTPEPDPSGPPPLSPEVQAELDKLLERISQARMPGDPPRPRTETAEEWIARFQAWIDSQPSRNPNVDDSRDSIYD
jgi:hypothetical protein